MLPLLMLLSMLLLLLLLSLPSLPLLMLLSILFAATVAIDTDAAVAVPAADAVCCYC